MAQSLPRIAIIADSLEGGLGAVAISEAGWLSSHGWEVHLCAPSSPSTTAVVGDAEWAYHPVEIPPSIKAVPAGRAASRAIGGVLPQVRPAIVHCHGLRSFQLTLGAHPSVPLVLTYHGGPIRSLPKRVFARRLAGRATLAYAASPGVEAGFTHLPHASPFLASHQMRSTEGATDLPLRLGWFSRLDPPKRPDLWLQALERAVEEGLPLEGHVIGSGSLLSEMRSRVDATGLPVTFHGALSADSAASLMDVLLAWSDSEAMSFTIQEMIWMGVPSLTNAIPGPMGLIGTCKTGPTDLNSFVHDLSPLLSSDHRRLVVEEQQVALARAVQPHAPNPYLDIRFRGLIGVDW